MIKVKVVKDNDLIKEIKIKGHAGYDEYGKDIVCASVSSIVTTTVNGLLRLDKKCLSFVDNKNLEITILKHDQTIDILLENMMELLKELEKNYKKYIKIEK